jgi:hypothetical protein
MSSLEKRGKGILLLHDIHPATVAALPGLLRALKEQGFRVVHVKPAEQPGRIEMADHGESAASEPTWPPAAASAPAGRIAVLPAPNMRDLGILLGGLGTGSEPPAQRSSLASTSETGAAPSHN